MTEAELINKLSKRYPQPMYAFLNHVRNQTGYSYANGTVRTADAIAVGLWKSRGYNLYGFEIKVSRGDWLHEYKDPEKADAIAKFCDYFYLVVSDAKIVQLDELPKNWGLLAWDGKSVKEIKQPTLIDAEPLSRAFLCGFMRNVTESIAAQYTPTVEVEKIIEDRVNARVESEVKQAVRNAGEYEGLVERLKVFEQASGIPLTDLRYTWNKPEHIGEAVKMVMEGRHLRIKESLEYMQESAKRILKDIEEELKKVPNP